MEALQWHTFRIIVFATAMILALCCILCVVLWIAVKRVQREGQFLEDVLHASAALLVIVDAQNRVVKINHRYAQLGGVNAALIEGKLLLEVPFLKTAFWDVQKKAFRWEEKPPFQARFYDKTGIFHDVEWEMNESKNSQNNEVVKIISGLEITDLLAYQTSLREMAERMDDVEAKERRRFARNLHDRINPLLTIANRDILDFLAKKKSREIRSFLSDLSTSIENILSNTRNMITELSASELFDFGLASALESLADEWQDIHHISILCDCEDTTPIPRKITIFIYESVKELMRNAIAHGEATHIEITLQVSEKCCKLCVMDNGKGDVKEKFYRKPGNDGGFGLFHIRDRVEYYDGFFDIDSEIGKGCRIDIDIPFRKEAASKNLKI